MRAPNAPRGTVSPTSNRLRRSGRYRITTPNGTATGEYLGMETPHGEPAILLRRSTGTESIPLHCITSIRDSAESAFLRTA